MSSAELTSHTQIRSMPQETESPVFAAVRAAARPVTVAELQKRGVAEVQSIRMGHVCDVLEQAIHSTVIARTVRDHEGAGLATEARDRFIALMKGTRPAGPDPLTETASRKLHHLQADLDRQRSDLDRDLKQLATDSYADVEDCDLERDLRRQFRRLASGESTLEQIEEYVVETSIAALRRERIHVRKAELAARQSDTRFLQRRIEKLAALLEETEQTKPIADQGFAAGHRSVEGLDPEDTQFHQKRDILEGLFDQNLSERLGESQGRRRGA